MENRLMLVILAVLAVAVLALTLMPKPQPTQAQAQNWTVLAGANEDDEALQALRFLPEKLTIHVGDSVTWKLEGEEHTIYFTAGEPHPMLEIVGPDGREYFNPVVFFPSEGKTYDGSKPFSGGYLSSDNDTFTLTFTKPGVYEYHCAFHPGMKGTITVIPANQPLPKTRADYRRIARSEAQQALMKARELHDQLLQPKVNAKPDGSKEYVLDMMGDPKTMATVLRFEPSPLRIKVGDTVTWRMLDYTEAHTVTFLEDPEETPELALVEPQENGPPLLVINPMVWKPMGGAVHKGSGYYNSGAMFRPEGEEPSTYSLTFTQPGTYEYICLIHAMMDMEGTIIVEPASMPTAQMSLPAVGFMLHIDAKKHINDAPEFVVHHFCKTLDGGVTQCLLFESDAPNARVIGVETIISPEIYAKLPQEEQASWHYHKDEIPLVEPTLPDLSEEEIQKVVAAIEDTYGRIVIFWMPGAIAPMHTPSVTRPQTGFGKLQPTIHDVIAKFVEAFTRGDAAGVAAIYTEDAKLLPPNSPMILGREPIQEFFQGFFETMQMGTVQLTLKTVELTYRDELAYEIGAYTLKFQTKEGQSMTDTGKYVTVWKRQADGSWKIIIDTWNTSEAAPPY